MWKLKVDADGKPVLDANGAAIYIKPDGTEYIADMAQMVGKIADLGREAADNRKAAETAAAALKPFTDAGITDAKAAKAALDTVKDIKDGDLINKGKLEEVRTEIKTAFTKDIADRDARIADLDGRYKNTMLSAAFNGSGFVKDKLILTPDLVTTLFRDRFKVGDDGKIMAVASDGKSTVYSIKKPGEPAEFDEALEIIVSQHPGKDNIMKGANNGGSGGTTPGGSNNGGKRIVKRSEFDAMQPIDQGKTARDPNVSIVD